MKNVVKTMFENHPIATIFLAVVLGDIVTRLVHGNMPLVVCISNAKAKTEA